MEFELDGQLLIRRIPDRLVALVTAQDGCLHIVSYHRPWHPTDGGETGDQTAQQRLLAHILLETDEHIATVFEPGCEEVAGLSAHALFAERHVAHLPPIDL